MSARARELVRRGGASELPLRDARSGDVRAVVKSKEHVAAYNTLADARAAFEIKLRQLDIETVEPFWALYETEIQTLWVRAPRRGPAHAPVELARDPPRVVFAAHIPAFS